MVGSMLAVMHNVPVVRNTATSTASFLIVMGCFSGRAHRVWRCCLAVGCLCCLTAKQLRTSRPCPAAAALQETVRFLQAADTPINSAVAGAGTGGFLYKLNGEP